VIVSLETAVNARAVAVFANATATLGASVVSGVYRAPGADALGIAGTQPTFECLESARAAASLDRGDTVTVTCAALSVSAVAHVVTDVRPDGFGLVTLGLDR